MRKFNELQQLYGFKRKGRISVLEATEIAFQRVPEAFSGNDLHRIAAREMLRPAVYPDTILRALRMLKKRGKVSYHCTDQVNSLYQKGFDSRRELK